MLRMPSPPISLLLALLTTAACTQQPAQVEMKGTANFTRGGSSYASNNHNTGPISTTAPTKSYVTASAPVASITRNDTVANASVGSIGVTDLTPPKRGASASSASAPQPASHASNAPTGTPFQKAGPAPSLSPAAGPTTKPAATSTNPWTGKPREVTLQGNDDQSFNLRPQHGAPKEQLVSDIKTKASTDKAVSKLDSIIGSEGASAAKSTAPLTREAKAESAGGFMWPVNSKKVISAYGPKGKGKANDGVNIASANGEPVWASADGEVVYVGNELGGYGNMVLIKHSGNKSTTYAHLSRATVDKYDRVKQGDIVGYVGSTGNVKEPQLHFAVRDGNTPVDPVKFMKRTVASIR
jgi:murein DD-endopeptidase MepM/ murein hydrolase activator NlpD